MLLVAGDRAVGNFAATAFVFFGGLAEEAIHALLLSIYRSQYNNIF
jgi:hypothetical protein